MRLEEPPLSLFSFKRGLWLVCFQDQFWPRWISISWRSPSTAQLFRVCVFLVQSEWIVTVPRQQPIWSNMSSQHSLARQVILSTQWRWKMSIEKFGAPVSLGMGQSQTDRLSFIPRLSVRLDDGRRVCLFLGSQELVLHFSGGAGGWSQRFPSCVLGFDWRWQHLAYTERFPRASFFPSQLDNLTKVQLFLPFLLSCLPHLLRCARSSPPRAGLVWARADLK